jgi:ATP-binding cassette subfamily C protein LapB
MRYMADAEPALLGVGFKIEAGQVAAVRGANGSGKSTLLKMIMGLYAPQSGCVRLDGIDIRQRDPMLLRRAICYVPQNAQFFPGTIRDNLLLCVPDVTDVEIENALIMSCAADEIASMPKGLDTIIAGDGSENVSFLLKQRLNLARAYLRPASIMLFDEASHSLGAENDKIFRENIELWRGQRTIVMVTHREDHARMADKVLTLDRGELINIETPRTAAMKKGNKS